MTKDRFLQLLRSPFNASPEDIKEVKEITRQFSYFNSSHLLYAKLLKEANHFQYDNALKQAAAHASDRKKLFELMECKHDLLVAEPIEEKNLIPEAIKVSDNIKEKQPLIEAETAITGVILTEGMPVVEQVEIVPIIQDENPVIEPPVEDRTGLSLENKSETHSFLQWLAMSKSIDDFGPKIEEQNETVAEKEQTIELASEEEKPENTVSVTDLIEKFITEEPRIAPAKATFYSPVNMARKSVEESDDIVSPTLAQIYFMQGNAQKAIETYQKLLLLYPEKSAFFAAQIEKINKGS